MPAHTRTEQEREFDLARMSRWYRAGMAPSEIADKLGLSRPQVSYDLKQIRERWVNAQLFNFNEAKALELERLDRIQEEAEQAFERSKVGRKRTRKHSIKNGQERSETIEETAGDPRYLAIRVKCIEQRCHILGLHAPLKIDAPMPIDKYRPIMDGMSVDELRTFNAILKRSVAAEPGADRGSGESGQG